MRDAEQTPGASLKVNEKLEVAQQLARLKVDIIEAGFPVSSNEDFEAVRRIGEDKPILGMILNRAEEDPASGAA